MFRYERIILAAVLICLINIFFIPIVYAGQTQVNDANYQLQNTKPDNCNKGFLDYLILLEKNTKKITIEYWPLWLFIVIITFGIYYFDTQEHATR